MAAQSTGHGQPNNLKQQLISQLDAVSGDIRQLLESLDSKSTLGSVSSTGSSSLNMVLEQITRREEEIQKLVNIAISMKHQQKEIRDSEIQLERHKTETDRLQARLIEAEKVLEVTLHQAKEKMKLIEKAQRNPVSPEDLIRYAHKISLANTITSPVRWQLNDPRRPFPQDIEMRQGFLGKLSSQQSLQLSKEGELQLSFPPVKQSVQASSRHQSQLLSMQDTTEESSEED